MGKIILEFDSVEELHDAKVALEGMKWKAAMWDLDQLLRNIVKYDTSIIDPSKPASVEEGEFADKVRELIRDILSDAGLNLED